MLKVVSKENIIYLPHRSYTWLYLTHFISSGFDAINAWFQAKFMLKPNPFILQLTHTHTPTHVFRLMRKRCCILFRHHPRFILFIYDIMFTCNKVFTFNIIKISEQSFKISISYLISVNVLSLLFLSVFDENLFVNVKAFH